MGKPIPVEKMSCLAEMSPVGNRIRLENGKVVFKPVIQR